MTSPTLFDQTVPTVLAELERRLNERFKNYGLAYQTVLIAVQEEIDKLKSAEIDQLKQAFAEGGAIPQSAESWVKKFSQGG
jgi:hypothetical protein